MIHTSKYTLTTGDIVEITAIIDRIESEGVIQTLRVRPVSARLNGQATNLEEAKKMVTSHVRELLSKK